MSDHWGVLFGRHVESNLVTGQPREKAMEDQQRVGREVVLGWWGAGVGEGFLGRVVGARGGRPLTGAMEETKKSLLERGFGYWEREGREVERRLAGLGAKALIFGEEGYPAQLAMCADCAPVLSVRGDVGVLSGVLVGVVGTRKASAEGRLLCGRVVGEVLGRGLGGVVSGGARGVDAVAHREALRRGVGQVLVCGTGIDGVYPFEHKQLFDAIAGGGGAVVSQFPPGLEVHPSQFPRRNATISGLSAVVVVVEAPCGSGALHTAAAANRQGREVFVVSGPALHEGFGGGHGLVVEGKARLLYRLEDLEACLRGGMEGEGRRNMPKASKAAQQGVLSLDGVAGGRERAGERERGVGVGEGGRAVAAQEHSDPLCNKILQAIGADARGVPRDLLFDLGEPRAINQRLLGLQLEGEIVLEVGDVFRRVGV